MKISKEDLRWAASKGHIEEQKIDGLWAGLLKHSKTRKDRFLIQILYYLGAFLIIGSMVFFLTKAFVLYSPVGITLSACLSGVLFLSLGYYFWFKREFHQLGGLLFTVALCAVPLIVFGIEKGTGFWQDENLPMPFNVLLGMGLPWLIIHAMTFLTGLMLIRKIRFPFLCCPVIISGWFFFTNLFYLMFETYSKKEYSNMTEWVSLVYGIGLLAVGYVMEKSRKDFSFWLHFFGLISFYMGLSLLWNGDSEVHKAIFCAINFFFILMAVSLNRVTFLIAGLLGTFIYLIHLCFEIFQNSVLFPFFLSLIGISIIGIGVFYNRHRLKIDSLLHKLFKAKQV